MQVPLSGSDRGCRCGLSTDAGTRSCLVHDAPARTCSRRVLRAVQDLEDPNRKMGPDALLKSIGKKQRHRTGYEAGASMLAKTVTAAHFVRCADPMPTLGSVTAILLQPPDPAAAAAAAEDVEEEEGADGAADAAAKLSGEEATALILEHPETDKEVRELCKDVQVLGRSEFKQLLRWRLKMRKAVDQAEKERARAAAAEVRAGLVLRAGVLLCDLHPPKSLFTVPHKVERSTTSVGKLVVGRLQKNRLPSQRLSCCDLIVVELRAVFV